ncbi:MAG: DUF1515 family protein [Mesorhizobium sp.]
MQEKGLNEIYQAIGSLTQAVKGVEAQIASNEKRNEDAIRMANESRANVHRRLDDIVERTAHLENSVAAVTKTLEEVEEVTVKVKTMRAKAQGAGTLGYWLLKLGGIVLSAAGGFAAAYTWLTGRPPP